MVGYLYAASFNPSGSGGSIHGFGWNARTGSMKPLGTVGQGVENPLCLLACPAGQYLHVGDCTADWRSGGALRSHRINPLNGTLELIGSVDSAGQIPVSLTLAANGANLLVANCGPFDASTEGCTVAVLPVKNGGRLGPAKTVQQHTGIGTDPQRQTSPHPHCVALDLANRYAWVPDLGTDSIWCYAYDAHLGALLLQPDRSIAVTAGSGPRLLRFHPRGDSAYLINAIANTLVQLRR